MQDNYSTMSEDDKEMDDMVYFQREEGNVREVAMKKIKVVAIDDHPVILQLVQERLGPQPDIEVVGTADHGNKLLPLVRQHQPDVVILDLHMSQGGFEPLTEIQALKQEFPKIQILIFTALESPTKMQTLTRAGVLGYVLKSDKILSLKLVEGVRAVYRGERFYSSPVIEALAAPGENPFHFDEQEMEILWLVAKGQPNKRIAEELNLVTGSVGNRLSEMYQKAGVNDRTEYNRRVALLNKAREAGLLPDDPLYF
ncbi:MAG: response regulator transcription factor [Anaerolineales bacterium]